MFQVHGYTNRLLAGALVATTLMAVGCSKGSTQKVAQQQSDAIKAIGQGNYNEANTLLMDAVSANPKDAQNQYLLAITFYQKKNYQAALDHFDQASKLDPNRVDIMVNIGNVYRDQKQRDKAEEWYRKAIAKQASYAQAHVNLAELYEDKGDFPGAIKILDDGMKPLPDNAQLLFKAAEVYEVSRQFDKAKGVYEHMLKLDPNNASAKAGLAALPKSK